MNKRGLSGTATAFIIGGGIFVLLILGAIFINSELGKSIFRDMTIDTATKGFDTIFGSAFIWMNWIFGGVPDWLVPLVGNTSTVIITIATFILLFVTFGDIIRTFSTFSEPVSWVSAFMISIIAANLKGIVVILGFFIGIFAFLGGLAVLAGLFAAFAAFFIVNWGIGGRFGRFVFRRRAMMHAEREGIKTEATAKELASTLKAIGEIGGGIKKSADNIKKHGGFRG